MEGMDRVRTYPVTPPTIHKAPMTKAGIVMVKFGSEPWFEPERNRTERQIGVEVRPLVPDRTDGSVRGSAHLSFLENASERGLNPNPSKNFRMLLDTRMKPCSY
jgi:hypothetical protein